MNKSSITQLLQELDSSSDISLPRGACASIYVDSHEPIELTRSECERLFNSKESVEKLVVILKEDGVLITLEIHDIDLVPEMMDVVENLFDNVEEI
jgi:hypothetical protein